MRILLVFILAFSFASCSRTRSITDATKSNSKVDPLFKAKNINQKFDGESVKLRVVIPMSQSTLGHYDVEDILAPSCYKEDENYEKCLERLKKYEEDQSIPDEEKSWWTKFKRGAKFDIYNLAIKMGYSSRLKYSFDYEFPEIPMEYFKQVKVKKIFFALEECDKTDLECIQRQDSKPVTFDFIEKFFMNISVIQDHDPLDFIENPFTTPNKKQFNRFADRAFGQRLMAFENVMNEKGQISKDAFYDLNIARMDNSSKKKKKNRRKNQNNIRDNGKTFIFTIEKDFIQEAKDFFESPDFYGIVSDTTLIGRSLYVDLHGSRLKEKFFNKINERVDDLTALGIEDFKGCSVESCASLNVNGINLVPMLDKSFHFKFDTFFSIKHLDYNDFKYNGYLELEIELDLPI